MDEIAARGGFRRFVQAWPGRDFIRPETEGGKRFGKGILRMVRGLRDAGPCAGLNAGVEAWQDYKALRQGERGLHQYTPGRVRAGRSCNDDAAPGRGRAPAGGHRLCGGEAAGIGVHLDVPFQFLRPLGGDDVEEVDRAAPVLGKLAILNEALKPAPVDLAGQRGLVEQTGQFAGGGQCGSGWDGLALSLIIGGDEPCQAAETFGGRDGRGQVSQSGLSARGRFVIFEITERPDLWHQQGVSACRLKQGER